MKWLVKALWIGIIAFTINIILQDHASAQGKKDNIATVETDSPWFEFIYQGESRESTAVRIRVLDRQKQYTAMDYARMKAQSKADDPVNYWVKLISVPEIHPLAFRQVESLEENAMPEDGVKVIVVRFKDLQEAALIWYNR